MHRLFASVSLAALVLAACTPDDAAAPEGEAAPAAEEIIAGTEAVEPGMETDMPRDFQLSYKAETENSAVTSEIDPAILEFDPQLAWMLWTATKSALDEFAAQAEGDRVSADEYSKESGDPSWFHSYTMDVTHTASLVLDDVISIGKTSGLYTGGAHPNYFLGGLIWRRGAADPVAVQEIIADEAAFTDLVVAGLVEEKLARGWAAAERDTLESSMREAVAPTADNPDVFAGRILLEPSTEAGKAGGVTVLFSPYDVGAYAEGSFEVQIEAADLIPVLTPEWKSRFAGTLPATE